MKPKVLHCLALLLSGVLFGCVGIVRAGELPTNAEPRYLDKSLSEWIPLTEYAGSSEVDLFRRRDERACPAVLAIGTNALPWLLHWIRSEKQETAQLGIEGFGVLGPIAKPAIPELIRLADDWRSSSVWRNAIPALAAIQKSNVPYALPFLLSAARKRSAPAEFRLQAVQSMVENRLGRKDVTSVFLLCLKDKYWAVAAKAAIGLCDLGLEPREVVPALAACLSSRTNMPVRSPAGTVDHKPIILEGDDAVRYSAAMALVAYSSSVHSDKSKNHDYRETMRAALPVLVKALSDEDWHVAMLAAVALGYAALEPDVAVPALVKCLNHPQPYVRDSAIRALGDFGEAARAAVPELAKLAQSDPGGYVGGGWASSALKKIIPQTKP